MSSYMSTHIPALVTTRHLISQHFQQAGSLHSRVHMTSVEYFGYFQNALVSVKGIHI